MKNTKKNRQIECASLLEQCSDSLFNKVVESSLSESSFRFCLGYIMHDTHLQELFSNTKNECKISASKSRIAFELHQSYPKELSLFFDQISNCTCPAPIPSLVELISKKNQQKWMNVMDTIARSISVKTIECKQSESGVTYIYVTTHSFWKKEMTPLLVCPEIKNISVSANGEFMNLAIHVLLG